MARHEHEFREVVHDLIDQLDVLAGHGLTYVNVRPMTGVPEIVELNIGHSIVSRSVLVGMERATREMLALLRS